MKTHDTLQILYEEQPAFYARKHQSGTGASADVQPDDGFWSLLPTIPSAPSRPTTQAERAVMHPGRQDLEWRYCQGAWVG